MDIPRSVRACTCVAVPARERAGDALEFIEVGPAELEPPTVVERDGTPVIAHRVPPDLVALGRLVLEKRVGKRQAEPLRGPLQLGPRTGGDVFVAELQTAIAEREGN